MTVFVCGMFNPSLHIGRRVVVDSSSDDDEGAVPQESPLDKAAGCNRRTKMFLFLWSELG
jgi:hypothetical protein